MEGFPDEILTIIFGHLDIDSLSNAMKANKRWIPNIKTVLKSNCFLDICPCNISKILELKEKFKFKNIRVKHSKNWHHNEGEFIDNVLKIIADSRSHVRKLILDGFHEEVVIEILNDCNELTHLHMKNMLKIADDTVMNLRERNPFDILFPRYCLARAAHHKYLDTILQLIEKEENYIQADQNLEDSEPKIEDYFDIILNKKYQNMLENSDESSENSDFLVQDIHCYRISIQADPIFDSSSDEFEPNIPATSSQFEPNYHASSSQVEPNFTASSSQVEPEHNASQVQVKPSYKGSQVEPNIIASSSQVEPSFTATSNQIEPNIQASSSQVKSNFTASSSHVEPSFHASSSQYEPNLYSDWDIFETICLKNIQVINYDSDSSDESCEEIISTDSKKKEIRKLEKLIKIPTLKYLKVKKAQNIFDIIRAPNLKSLTVIIFNPKFNHILFEEHPEQFNQTLEKATKFEKIQNFIKTTEKLKVLVLNKLNVNCLLGFEPYPFKLEQLSITTYGSDEFNSMFQPTQATYFYESILRLLEHQKGNLKDVSIESHFLKFSQNQILTIMEGENMSKLSIDAFKEDANLLKFKFDKTSKELKFFGSFNFENEFVELISRFPNTRNLNLNVKGLLSIDVLRIIRELMPNLIFLSIDPYFSKISEDFKFESIEKLELHNLYEGYYTVDWDQIVLACPNIKELILHDDYFIIKSDKFERILRDLRNLKTVNKCCKKKFSVPYDFYKFLCKSSIIDIKISIFAKIKYGRYKSLTDCLSNNPEFRLSYEHFYKRFNCEDPKSYLKSFEIKKV